METAVLPPVLQPVHVTLRVITKAITTANPITTDRAGITVRQIIMVKGTTKDTIMVRVGTMASLITTARAGTMVRAITTARVGITARAGTMARVTTNQLITVVTSFW